MTHRIGFLLLSAAALLCVGVLGVGGSTAESADQATLPGDPEPHTQGCVDCHSGDGPDKIGALLEEMGHRKVDDKTTTVPGDCVECHSDDGGYTLLSEAVHLVHFEDPAKNPFVTDHGGNCLHCHALDLKTGAMSVKSGPKNW